MGRRCRRATVLIAVCAFFAGTTTTAFAFDLPSQTIEVCQSVHKPGGKLTAKLQKIGWRAVNSSDADAFSAVFTDGAAAAMSGDRTSPIDWAHALPQAQKFASSVFNASMEHKFSASAFLSSASGQAALLVIGDPSIKNGFRCVYSGPSDGDLRELLALMARMEKHAGLKQATPEVQITVIDSVKANHKANIQVSRFIRPMNKHFGRDARVELGFSLINAPTR